MSRPGYTMIELMVVLVIVAILVMVGVVSYYTSIIRARVSEGLALASSAKLAVAEHTMAYDRLPGTQEETGYLSPTTQNVTSITIANDGSAEITITYGPQAGDGTIILKPSYLNREILWNCTGGSLSVNYRPANCR